MGLLCKRFYAKLLVLENIILLSKSPKIVNRLN